MIPEKLLVEFHVNAHALNDIINNSKSFLEKLLGKLSLGTLKAVCFFDSSENSDV